MKFDGRQNEHEQIALDKLADVLVLHKNAMTEMSNSSRVHTVIRVGQIYQP